MGTSIFTQTQISSVEKLKELCDMHPDDPTFNLQLAERLKQEGHEIRAIFQARKAYDILSKESPQKAGQVLEVFGKEVIISEEDPHASPDFSALAKTFGMITFNMRKIRVKEGTVLFKKGDLSNLIYLILEGELAVNSDNKESPILLNYLSQGDLVGESALDTGGVRNATVVANKNAVLLRFSKKELLQAFEQNPELYMQFSKEKLWRERITSLSSSPVFACIPLDLRYMLARRAWLVTHQAGTTIKPPHAYMPNVELITHGVVHMYEYEKGQLPLYCGRIQTGDILGLHKIVSGKASRVAYEADTLCQSICFDFALVSDLIALSPKFRTQIRNKAAHFSTQVSRTMTLQA